MPIEFPHCGCITNVCTCLKSLKLVNVTVETPLDMTPVGSTLPSSLFEPFTINCKCVPIVGSELERYERGWAYKLDLRKGNAAG